LYAPDRAGERRGQGGAKTYNQIVILHMGKGLWPHHPCQIWWPSAPGFGENGGQVLPFSIELNWLTLWSLKHPGTTVPAC